ncbi:dolichol-P-mannose synthesis [Glugoides intestinalis]
MLNVILSTYNEADNIKIMLRMLIKTLEKIAVPYLIIVVDGNSPDQTSKIAKSLKFSNMLVIDEPFKAGLGKSYEEGLKHCIYEYTIILDADMQHDPFFIQQMYKLATSSAKYDIVSGTRYSKNGMVSGWTFKRKFLSMTANNLAKYIIGLKSTDLTGSFRCYRTSVLKELLSKATCKGFGLQMEAIARAEHMGLKIAEIPIVFHDRIAGNSKLGSSEMLMFLKTIFNLYLTL